MRKIILFILFISFSAYSQANRFTGTWSNENCKDCSKKYILKITMAQSNNKIYGTAEVISDNAELNSGIMEVTGNVYVLGEKAQITMKSPKGSSAGATLYVNEDVIQFNKSGGSDLVPKEVILKKLYE
ncbi:hypothetical protein IRZ71_06060 [Flavobacterium sp. ANB]|uniref:hypothetical protein n=1 Tax=unclassified Flavobacterium TaxID=196869 RepID=UPI0012B77C32|nr:MULTISPECIES: hypothetical protein [unclassified Flavobacterium]MBF4515895.1 hypothetical protein [Flavobacterium sp. ANB]MTD68897.1 hypothetical protein [Flavobacterium sp. LC2016-13]